MASSSKLPRSRRSIAYVPRSKASSSERENATADVGSTKPHAASNKSTGKDKKSRSKSLGPGGLDALQDSSGNRRQVCYLEKAAPMIKDTKRVTLIFCLVHHPVPSEVDP